MTAPDSRHEHVHQHPDGDTAHDHPHGRAEAGAPGGTGPGGSAPLDAGSTPDEALAERWIDITHLHYHYPDGFEALKGIHLTVGRGEKVALVGPNGAGKSTLMLHLNGIFLPSHGQVRVGGLKVERATLGRVRSVVGVVFQDPDDQLFSPTVYEDVAFGPLHMGLPHDQIHERVEQALAAVGMAGFGRRIPHRLSLGQRKRVALATVLSMDPSILVFDEPSAGLDPRGRRELIALLRTLDQTLVVSTHDMRLVAEVFGRTVVMDDGLIVADGPTEVILSDDAILERHGLERP